MIVVKLGGSLAESGGLTNCLLTAERRYRSQGLIIVPGGGAFAEQVRIAQRQWRFDDRTAHEMAVLAMQQTALMCQALNPRLTLVTSVNDFDNRTGAMVWSPAIAELNAAGIRPSWAITSDSLAAWLTRAVSARELILVKSVDIAGSGLDQVDDAFADFIRAAPFNWRIVGKNEFLSG
jgi:aspartokinase-like uncharacterized kinase